MLTPEQIRDLVHHGFHAGAEHHRTTGQENPPPRGWPGCKEFLKPLLVADMHLAAAIFDAAARLGVEQDIESHHRA